MLTLIEVFVMSLAVGAWSPNGSAAYNDVNTTPFSDSTELTSGEGLDFDPLDLDVGPKPEFVPGEVLVNFAGGTSVRVEDGRWITGIKSIDELIERFEVSAITRAFLNVHRISLGERFDVFYVAREFEGRASQFIKYAEPNGIAHTLLVPNDGNYTQQWAHQVIESEYAWNVTTGDSDVVIAVVDTGVDYNHPDLAANVWINTDEIPDNGVDDDSNGFVDDVRGWDFVDSLLPAIPGEDATEPDNDPMDFLGHGTVCAGIVAATTNNTVGIAGTTWNSKIMAVRSGYATSGGGVLLYDQIAAGIRYAVDNNADIINLSFGGYLRSQVVYDAVKYAYDNGALLVGAAGNDFVRIKIYPAAYEEVVAVTATDESDDPAHFTNFGNWVEVAAPGVNILSTVCPNAYLGPYGFEYPYDYAGGTSTAAPYAAGVAALILSQFSYMTRDQVRVQLRRTAVDLSPEGFDIYYGYGRISARGAVEKAPAEHDLLILSWKLPLVSAPGDTVTVNTIVLNFGNNVENKIDVKLLVNGTEEDSTRINRLGGGESATVSSSWTVAGEGIYNVTTYVVPAKFEPSNATEDNAQSAYSWAKYGKTVKVPQDFPTIQEAIETTNLAIYGGEVTVQVSNGTYYEYDLLMQNMLTSLTLAGESSSGTIILGDPSFDGVYANSDNVTVSRLTIQDCYTGVKFWGDNCVASGNNLAYNTHGVFLSGCYNNTITGNTMSGNGGSGVEVRSSTGNIITNNTSSSNRYGLYLRAANTTLASDNTFANNQFGVWIMLSCYDLLTNNNLTGNTYGFGVQGDTLPTFIHDIDTTNTVDGNPIYYLINQTDLIIDPSTFTNVGYLGLVNSTGITVRDLSLSKNLQGVMFAHTKDSTIQNITSSSNTYGICFYGTHNTFIINSTITSNYYGIYTLDCANNTVSDNTLSSVNYGIYLSKSSSSDIRGNALTGTSRGINIYASEDNTFEDNTVVGGLYCFYVYSSGGNTFQGNTVTSGTYGMYLLSSGGNTFQGNTVTSGTYGLYLSSCESSVFTGNNLTGNNYNFFVYGSSLAEYFHYVNTSNKVNGKPMYYLLNQTHLIVEPSTFPDIGYLGLVNSTNITVENVSLPTNNGQGLLFAYVTESAIRNVNVSSNYHGLHLFNSNETALSGNTLSSNVYGLIMRNSHNNTVDGDFITEIDRDGLSLTSSSGNTISGTTVANCSRVGSYNGIILSDSGNNTIMCNTISDNRWSIRLVSSSDNSIYHNNFIDGTSQVYNSGSSNSWDDGYPSGGNYWSDYTGLDNCSGPYQNETGSDGIGDTPRVIGGGNQDNYPLMDPWVMLLHALNLHVMDWDLTDSIPGAYVYADSDVKISDANGWANWTGLSGSVYVKVKWHGAWVNGTFTVVMNSGKTIDVQCNIFDVMVTATEGEQGAVLQYVNVTVYNATNGTIRTGITDSAGQVYLPNVPNATLTFTCYEGSSPQSIIANTTRTITTEDQAETIVCDQNYASANQEWDIITDYSTFSLSLIPSSLGLGPLLVVHAKKLSRFLRVNVMGLKERVKTIRSKQNKGRKEVKTKT